jgi:hypothetical protein
MAYISTNCEVCHFERHWITIPKVFPEQLDDGCFGITRVIDWVNTMVDAAAGAAILFVTVNFQRMLSTGWPRLGQKLHVYWH